jgi:hypothetical protein
MCDHDHDHNGACDHGDESISFSLYQKINTVNLECLNELTDGTGARVFKPWSERLSNDVFVESDCDAELLFNIPFTGDVKLKGIIVRADEDLHKMRLFKSSLRMSFDDVSAEADQEFEVAHDPTGTHEYPVKPTKFSNVHHLTIHFENKDKEDEDRRCRIFYIGLRGDFSQVNRDGVVIANYELRPTENIGAQIDIKTREVQ